MEDKIDVIPTGLPWPWIWTSIRRTKWPSCFRASQHLALLSIEYFRDVDANFTILATALANGSNEMYFITNSEALEMGINIWDENRDQMVLSKGVTRFTR
jgi:hypothetical protein